MKQLLLAILLLGLLAGCTTPPELEASLPTSTRGALTPYPSATASQTPMPTDAATPTPLPSATPTPRAHTLSMGQDLFGLSLYYDVTVADIMAMNPGLDPNAMRVGTVILIPPALSQPGSLATATPAPLQLGQPTCHLTAEGSAVCFVLAHNPLETRIEAVSVIIRLQSAGVVSAQTAYLPLDGIPAGAALPLSVVFPAPLQAPLQSSAELLSAIPLNGDDTRHLVIQPGEPQINIHPDGLSARVSSSLSLPVDSPAASRIWVLAVAYNAAGEPVGMRRWESTQPLAPGASQELFLNVYSAGGMIERVEVFAEALR